MASSVGTRSERVHLRLSPREKHMVSLAAAAVNKSLSGFLLDSGLRAANCILVGRPVTGFDDSQWADFVAALND